MTEFLFNLQQHINTVNEITNKIEADEAYMENLKEYLPSLNQMIQAIFEFVQNPAVPLELNQEFVLQVLNDILYGIENRDDVFLLDVLRYGLLEIYYYMGTELQGGKKDEQTNL